MVPGLVVLVMTVLGALLTALVVAREWEQGTFEALFVTPVRAGEILLAKVIPYLGLGIFGLVLCMLAARFLFQVPFRGSLWLLSAGSLISCPSRVNRTVPRVGRRSPATILRRVDFPVPFGPVTATTIPPAAESETPVRTRRAPKRFSIPVSSSAADIFPLTLPQAEGARQAPQPRTAGRICDKISAWKS